jgi:hypothetical protein
MGVPPEPIPDFDLYAELEVAPSASVPTIDAAWRSLVKRHHPDASVVQDPEGGARIRRLNIAHHWLIDPARRARYDAERALRSLGGRQTSQRQARPGPGETRAGATYAADAASAAEPDWGEVRRAATRARRPASGAPTLLDSPILMVAIGAITLVAIMAVVLIGPSLIGSGRPTRPLSATSPVAEISPSPTSTSTPTPAEALAATLPDRVGGVELTGETAAGADVFAGDLVAADALLASTGGRVDDLIGAYKSGVAANGDVLSIVALRLGSVKGTRLADAFRSATAGDPTKPVSWSDARIVGRRIATSVDASDPRFTAYLIGAADAMYLVVTSNTDLAEAAIRALP